MKILACLAMILSLGVSEAFAADYSGTSSGIFVNPVPDTTYGAMNVTGVGTSNFIWGDPLPTRSSLSFTGNAFSGNFEQEFKFGTLQYYNGTIVVGSGAKAIDLLTTLSFTTPTGINKNFNFNFDLITTPNTNDPNESADYVHLVQQYDPTSSFTYDGNNYFLQFTRFVDPSGSNATEFHVLEGNRSSADLYGKLTVEPSNPAVPEPSTMLLLGGGLAGLALWRRKKQQK